jgi:hypothetical protein
LANETRIARKALDPYLASSAVLGSVITTGADVKVMRSLRRSAAARSSQPMRIRDGSRKSWSARPSWRNSGFATTGTRSRNSRSTSSCTHATVPGGTVLRITMRLSFVACRGPAAIHASAWRSIERLGYPASPCGVGTATNVNAVPGHGSSAVS